MKREPCRCYRQLIRVFFAEPVWSSQSFLALRFGSDPALFIYFIHFYLFFFIFRVLRVVCLFYSVGILLILYWNERINAYVYCNEVNYYIQRILRAKFFSLWYISEKPGSCARDTIMGMRLGKITVWLKFWFTHSKQTVSLSFTHTNTAS